jgi:putative resolvase
MEERQWITLGKAAAILEVHPGTLSRWAVAGKIPHVRTIGGMRRFPVDVIERLAAEQRAPLETSRAS